KRRGNMQLFGEESHCFHIAVATKPTQAKLCTVGEKHDARDQSQDCQCVVVRRRSQGPQHRRISFSYVQVDGTDAACNSRIGQPMMLENSASLQRFPEEVEGL